jgi:TldD protein
MPDTPLASDALAATLRELVAELDERFPYAAALLSDVAGVRVLDMGREQNAAQLPPTRGVVFTVYDGASFVEYASGELAPDGLAREVRAWAGGLRMTTDGPPLPPETETSGDATEAATRSFRTAMEIDPRGVALAEKLAHVAGMQRLIHGTDPRIVQARVQYLERTERSAYVGRGRYLEQEVTRVALVALIAASDGTVLRQNAIVKGNTGGFEIARMSEDELRGLVEVGVRLLEAGKIDPGEYEVISDPSISGVIAHESFGHGVEMDLYPKGRARSAHFLGRQVGSPLLQMYDDPSFAGGYGSYFFDDEGEAARPVQILREGVFVSPISDLASATFAPGARTPNGRRQDFTRKTYARMTNTFFARGATPVAEMIAGVERGVYLRQAESGMEDPMGWGIQITARIGEEIRDGKLTGRLFTPVGVTGSVPEVLGSVSAVGDDFDLQGGSTCGKGHKEFVPVSSGGPHLRMKARLG